MSGRTCNKCKRPAAVGRYGKVTTLCERHLSENREYMKRRWKGGKRRAETLETARDDPMCFRCRKRPRAVKLKGKGIGTMCEHCRTVNARGVKRYFDRLMVSTLPDGSPACNYCGKRPPRDPLDVNSYCEDCNNRMRINNQAHRDRCRKAGICHHCGSEGKVVGESCAVCTERERFTIVPYSRKYGHRKEDWMTFEKLADTASINGGEIFL